MFSLLNPEVGQTMAVYTLLLPGLSFWGLISAVSANILPLVSCVIANADSQVGPRYKPGHFAEHVSQVSAQGI